MTRKLLSLPSDIVFEIFSYVDQTNVVECLLVCRDWQSEVPKFIVGIWKRITVSRTSWPKTNDCMLRCLGAHVKDVIIHNFNAKDVLVKLKKYKCAITQLGIQYSRHQSDVRIDDDHAFLSTIKQFNDSLERLSIVHVSASHLSPLDALAQFPSLTHFTLLLNNPIPEYKSPVERADAKRPCYNKLTYLHLDVNVSFEHSIIPVVRRCPQLKVLLLSHFGIPPSDNPDNFDSIFENCPHLTHFLWNEKVFPNVFIDPVVNEWSALPTSDENSVLRQIIFRGDTGIIKTLEPILMKSCNELERLQLYADINIISHLSFPKLKRVSIRGAAMSDDEFRALLQGLSAIESMDLVIPEHTQMAILGESITSLEHLRHIKLNSLAEPADDDEARLWNRTSFLASASVQN